MLPLHSWALLQASEQLLRALAALWAVTPEAVQQHTTLHKPAVQAGAADLSVGRATLPLVDAAAGRKALAASAGGGGSRFAPTGHALRNMERVAAATSMGEPVLLVGETGTGKTTLVQQIAKQVRRSAVSVCVVVLASRPGQAVAWRCTSGVVSLAGCLTLIFQESGALPCLLTAI